MYVIELFRDLKMDVIVLCSMFVVITTVECVDIKRLVQKPRPKPLFDVSQYKGQWFVQTRLSPRSWSIPNVTDSVSYFTLQPDKTLLSIESWRVEHCNYLTYVYTPRFDPGVYNLQDSIGDKMSGPNIIVETDYVTFAVIWGCPKISLNGTCEDPYVLVQTRDSFPSAFTMLTIQYVLYNKWNLYLNEMSYIPQVRPCDKSRVTGQSTECVCAQSEPRVTGNTRTMTMDRPQSQEHSSMYSPGSRQQTNGVNPFNQMAMMGLLDGMA